MRTSSVAATFVTVAVVTMAATYLVVSARPTSGETTTTATDAASVTVRACGDMLADLLHDICRQEYYLPRAEQSNDAGAHEDKVTPSAITRECCMQPCTLNQLSQYCANTSSTDPTKLQLYIYTVERANNASGTSHDSHPHSPPDDTLKRTKPSPSPTPPSNTRTATSAWKSTSSIAPARPHGTWSVKKKDQFYFEVNTARATRLPMPTRNNTNKRLE